MPNLTVGATDRNRDQQRKSYVKATKIFSSTMVLLFSFYRCFSSQTVFANESEIAFYVRNHIRFLLVSSFFFV